jgi:coenzyme F420-reducing hydrogenase beta subunit
LVYVSRSTEPGWKSSSIFLPFTWSWISAKDHNGRKLFDGVLDQGDSQTFQDSEKIELVLGDAGAIQLQVNGKKIEDDFQPGSVERLTYTKGDPEVG